MTIYIRKGRITKGEEVLLKKTVRHLGCTKWYNLVRFTQVSGTLKQMRTQMKGESTKATK